MTDEQKEPVKKKAVTKKKVAPEETKEVSSSPKKKKPETTESTQSPKAPVEEKAVVTNFGSESCNVTLEASPFCRMKLTVEANAPFVKEARKDAIRKIAKEVSIPGFRKGKAPDSLIEKNYSNAVSQNWERSFADNAFAAGQKLAKVTLLGGNSKVSYQVNRLTSEGGEISFTFEAEPTIPDIDYTKLSIPSDLKEEKITEEKVRETIKHIQMFYARWNQVHDRSVKEGDFVVLDIDDLDQDPPVQAFSNARFEVAQGKMADWMRELVLGKNLNDKLEAISRPDEKESEEIKKEFKPKKVKVVIKAIEEAVLPEVDDAFAKRLGADDLNDLNTKLKNLLTKQAAQKLESDTRDAISDQLIEKFPFDVPASVLEKEANYRIHQLFKTPGFAKAWKEEMSEEEKEKKKEEIKQDSVRILKIFYFARKIVGENRIELTEEEMAPHYENILEMMFADPDTVNYKNKSKEQQALAFSKYMIAKALDFVVQKVQ